jgi:aryl-alcohol dehydrogenase-like predicted oxidoreductase
MVSADDMEYTTLGTTGIEVSRICLGCMSFGDPDWREWVLPPEKGHELVERALELGVTFFDTANMYSKGESERVLGEALAGRRDETVVATKGYFQMDEDNPHSGGLSRKALRQELAASVERLGGEPVDLYQVHRMDDAVAPEHLMRTLDDAVRSGQVHHVGASSMWAHDLAAGLEAAERAGLEPFVSMQDHYNLVYREGERETFPLCDRENLAVLPWSPLARGYLARPDEAVDRTARGEAETRLYGHPYRERGGPTINERVEQLADERGVKMAQIALAWTLSKEFVTAPIVGTTTIEHLEDAVEALTIDLSDADVEWLEEPYEAVRVSGHV